MAICRCFLLDCMLGVRMEERYAVLSIVEELQVRGCRVPAGLRPGVPYLYTNRVRCDEM